MTPRLQWKSPDGREQVFMISSQEVLIGRTSVADIVVPDRHVSRQHAKVVAVPDGWQLVDLNSTYGTFVNNERVDRRILRHGDTIVLGRDVEFRYFTEPPAGPHDADTTRIMQESLKDLGRLLPSEASDLEKILCVLDFQYQWSQVFTPDAGLHQILESTLRISGAERAFVMVRKGEGFGYAAGLDGHGRKLSETHFRASGSIVREVSARGKPIFMVEGLSEDFEKQQSIVAMNLRAIACLPLRGIPTGGESPEILGILYLDSTKAMHSLSGLDQKILTKLADEAGKVLERVEMLKTIEQQKSLERDLALAEETQRNLLPREIPRLERLKLHAYSRPTRYVGGDFYHFQVMDSGELIGVLADVSGKGIAASLLSSMLLGCLQLLLTGGSSTVQALQRLNAFLHAKAPGRFVTMFLFSIGPDGAGEFVSAGHNPCFVYRASRKEIEELPSNSLIIGAFDFATFQADPLHLDRGDVLLVYSDGLTEAEDPSGAMFGFERVRQILLDEAPSGAEKVHQALLFSLQEFTRGRAQTDDITMIIAEQA